MTVRAMEARDFSACERVAREAFGDARRPGHAVRAIARCLESAREAEPRLAFVAGREEVEGFVVCAKGALTRVCGTTTEHLCVGPLAVSPRFRGRGVGGALTARALDAARGLGYGSAVLMGPPGYFSRFGFAPAARHGIFLSGHSPSEDLPCFMSRELSGEREPWYGGFFEFPAFCRACAEEARAFCARNRA